VRLGEDARFRLDALGALSEHRADREANIHCAPTGCEHLRARRYSLLVFAGRSPIGAALRHIIAACARPTIPLSDWPGRHHKAMQAALNLGMNTRFGLHTPLMWRDKAATWQLAERLVVPFGRDILEHTIVFC